MVIVKHTLFSLVFCVGYLHMVNNVFVFQWGKLTGVFNPTHFWKYTVYINGSDSMYLSSLKLHHLCREPSRWMEIVAEMASVERAFYYKLALVWQSMLEPLLVTGTVAYMYYYISLLARFCTCNFQYNLQGCNLPQSSMHNKGCRSI
jgi:hypothetical protein